jgi:protein gp37
MAIRLKAMGQPNYSRGFLVSIHEEVLGLPLHWKKPQMVFVNSMSDLFHEEVPTEFIHRVFDVMTRATSHRFQILTKRSERMVELSPELPWAPNIWMGVSVEDQEHAFRTQHLRQTGAHVKFLSLEPLLGPVDLDLNGIDWVIVGGESGPKARLMEKSWVVETRDRCRKAGVPFFFKQWGGVNKKKSGRQLDGRTWDETPLTTMALSGSACLASTYPE